MPKLSLTRRPKQSQSKTRMTVDSSAGLTRISVRRNEDEEDHEEGSNNEDAQVVGSTQRQTVKLTDKIETPLARQKKLQMAESNNKESSNSLRSAATTFSIVAAMNHNNNNDLNGSTGANIGSSNHNGNNGKNRQNTFIVCLKINKSLFNQIFKRSGGGNNINGKGMLDPFNEDSIMSAELQMELSQDKTLDVPEIWGLSTLDIKPERVHFKQFADIDEECLNQRLNTRTINDKKIHLVLASFKNKTWPSSSPYACWNCTEHFENAPVGIPTIAMSDNYEDTYYLEGNFCSFNCAARHLFDTHNAADSQLFTIYEILNFIYNELSADIKGGEYEKIKLAPERICLKKFGGHLSLEEYRKNFMTKVNYEVFRSPLIPALYHIQENTDLTRLIRNTNRQKKTRL